MSDTRRAILLHIKQSGGATIAEIARHLAISDEGARQHLILLERQGWVSRRSQHTPEGKSGRPASVYEISRSGEEFFPKRYAELSGALIDAVEEMYGTEAVRKLMARIVENRVREWEPRLRDRSLDERLDALRNYYVDDDPFLSVERNGHVALVERNCPFTGIASRRPLLCGMTVTALTRLLGVRVSRERSFQCGDGCCEFRVHPDKPVDSSAVPFSVESHTPQGHDHEV